MTPGVQVEILRNDRVVYTARVDRIAPICGDAILVDIRHPDGREVRPTGGMLTTLRLRAKVSSGAVIGQGGFGGEMRARVAT